MLRVTLISVLILWLESKAAAFVACHNHHLPTRSFFTLEKLDISRKSSDAAEGVPDNSNGSHDNRAAKRRVAVLLCPAQFCVPNDYQEFFSQLALFTASNPEVEIVACRVAELPRTEWIKVARSLPTRAFLEARLPVASTLSWYFAAIEKGIAEIFAKEGPDVNLCIIGHSIGGWVARGYLGGLSQSSTAVHRFAMEQCTSLVTLGTPHVSPETSLVDQTRGLLREIEESPGCKPQALTDRGIDITCVSSSGLGGRFLTSDIEELVAASSYLPLLGKTGKDIKGDGIVPLDLAFMGEPARRVIIEKCSLTNERVRHSHVLPTPWSLLDGYSPSIRLQFPSYVSEGVLPLWAKYIR
jgi:hypothetical protein